MCKRLITCIHITRHRFHTFYALSFGLISHKYDVPKQVVNFSGAYSFTFDDGLSFRPAEILFLISLKH